MPRVGYGSQHKGAKTHIVKANYQYNGTHIITLQKTAHGTIYELTKGGG